MVKEKRMKKLNDYMINIIAGISLIILALVLLIWNESKIAKDLAASREVEKNVNSISADKIIKDNDSKLVFLTGEVKVSDTVEDLIFNVSVVSPKMVRIVEVYQWQYKNGGYEKVWSEDLINSSDFNDSTKINPTEKTYLNKDYKASIVKVGSFTLSNTQKDSLLSKKMLTTLSTTGAEKLGYKIKDAYYISSIDPNNPEIGDVRVSFYYNDIKTISILALQTNNTFSTYITDLGRIINNIYENGITLKNAIESIDKTNELLNWILRGVGLIISIVGFLVLLNPFSKIKFIFPIIKISINGIVPVISISLGSSISSFAVSFSWLFYRPLIGVLLLFLSFALSFVVFELLKQRKEEEKAQKPILTDGVKDLEEINNNVEVLKNKKEVKKLYTDIKKEKIKENVEILDLK